MAKLEDVLKAKGYSEADLTALAPMLQDARLRGSLEGYIADAEYHAEVGRADSAEALRWRDEEALPKLQDYMKQAEDARVEAAGYRERMKVLQDQGLIKVAEGQGVKVETPVDTFDHKKYKLVTEDDQRAVVEKFADLEGDAIAAGIDLAAEYGSLFNGKSLYEYQGQNGLRGFRALRKEAVAAKKPVNEYVAEKFKFTDRRTEIATAAAAKQEADIRADERAKFIAANPMARAPQSSAFTMLPKPAGNAGKQPWEVEGDRSGQRVAKVAASLVN